MRESAQDGLGSGGHDRKRRRELIIRRIILQLQHLQPIKV
jgi:hypothetical protein